MLAEGYKATLSALAEADVDSIVEFLDNEAGVTVGTRFLTELDVTLGKLEFFWAYEIKYDNIRTMQIRPFSYFMHYRVDEVAKAILIITILHARRDSSVGK